MRTAHRFHVHPAIPDRLACLRDLAYNLRWTWDHDTIELFMRLSAEHWRESGHNPVLLLNLVAQSRLEEAAEDDAFLAHLDRVCAEAKSYMTEPGWFRRRHPEAAGLTIAYFSMEYGLAECLPIYSGGLGVLSGDHLKSASDLDLPLVAVGLLYQKGYFSQYLNPDGWQLEEYHVNDFTTLPLEPVRDGEGRALKVHVDLAGRRVTIKVWRAQVGRVPLFLLDTNLPENHAGDQDVTDELYGGGPEERIRQEIVLGIGGVRALRAMGISPHVCHLNEGHSAFLSLERVHDLRREAGLDYQSARQVAGAGTVFTTHTPVSAGFDLFSTELVTKYFSAYVKDLGLGIDEFLARGRTNPDDTSESFNVAALALRHSPRRNSVSRLHRSVTAGMMRAGWPDLPEQDMPIDYVTNGVHTRGWVASDTALLYDRYLGPRWREDPADPEVWERVEHIPDEELWRTHVRQRERLVVFARTQLEVQMRRRNAPPREIESARDALRSDALTIGFARRFATYKRATLLLREVDRLKTLLLDERRPVQVVFAGKAHPRDDAGKEYIREIVRFAQQEGVRHRLVFIEDYDLGKARALVQGVDVWLNTPRRPLEASGTSGMKVVANGGLNLSILDGWWDEGYREGVGWAIGSGEVFDDFDYQDRVEAQSLYSLLEQEIVPLFYDRGVDGLSRGWVAMMKASIRELTPAFSTTRMVREYAERFYLPAAAHFERLSVDNYAKARELAGWKAYVRDNWSGLEIVRVGGEEGAEVPVGAEVPLEAEVRLGALSPADVAVQVYHGTLDADGTLAEGDAVPLTWVSQEGDLHLYRGVIVSETSGMKGYSVRVLPRHEDVLIPNELQLIAWE
ncbi:MAG: alpha-glucan family phosphorylase [Thermoleophilia bacterium]